MDCIRSCFGGIVKDILIGVRDPCRIEQSGEKRARRKKGGTGALRTRWQTNEAGSTCTEELPCHVCGSSGWAWLPATQGARCCKVQSDPTMRVGPAERTRMHATSKKSRLLKHVTCHFVNSSPPFLALPSFTFSSLIFTRISLLLL